MSHFTSNLRDIEFTLFEVLDVQDRLGSVPFEQSDLQTLRDVLRELNSLTVGPLGDSFSDADRNPPVFDPVAHSVAVPQSLKDSYQLLWQGEWWRLEVPTALGGFGLPPSLRWAAAELIIGANPVAYMYMAGPTFAAVLHGAGTAEQQHWAELMLERGWGATMVLTEPDAGSDVGAGRTKAVEQADGSWHIEGVKRFITSAEHDLTENIMHFVLARPQGAGPGTKGLSLFLVPKYRFDSATGELGERNGAYVTNLEHKMGLKGSATCELTFGAHDGPAVGWLLGDAHDGIAQMFEVLEWARMMVGAKAIGAASAGYLAALEYAKQRVQGADLARMGDKSAPRVGITSHPDVRRLLMMNKAYAEGLRALYLYTATYQDRIQVASARGEDAVLIKAVNDLLLPIVKGVASERAPEQLLQSLQVLGGSGYLQDYPIEQYIRDCKIDSLYEGTTAIQSLDLLFRKILRDRGAAFSVLTDEIHAFLNSEAGNGRLKEDRALLATALSDVQAMLGSLRDYVEASHREPASVYKAGQHSVRFLLAAGDLLIGWLLLRQASVALTALGGELASRDRVFYEGKVGAAHFFATTVLPTLSAHRVIVESADNALMDLAEASF